jgi:hypothetical protein
MDPDLRRDDCRELDPDLRRDDCRGLNPDLRRDHDRGLDPDLLRDDDRGPPWRPQGRPVPASRALKSTDFRLYLRLT